MAARYSVPSAEAAPESRRATPAEAVLMAGEVEELTRRYPRLEMAGPPVRRPLLVLRGFETVPVRAPRARLERQAKK